MIGPEEIHNFRDEKRKFSPSLLIIKMSIVGLSKLSLK